MDPQKTTRFRYAAVFAALLCALFIATVLSISLGSVPIPVGEIVRVLFGLGGEAKNADIIWLLRLPQVITAALMGGALALSGFLLQTFFANPIAGPFVLGISSGAKLMVAAAMVFFADRALSSWVLVGAAFLGSLLAMGLVLVFSRRFRGMAVLLVAGIMIGYVCSALTDFIIAFASDADIVNLRAWALGSFSGLKPEQVTAAAVVVGFGVLAAFLLSKPIGAYQMGEAYAQSMGVNVRAFRVLLILLSSLLSACVTAFAGPISFVGIAVPHLVKRALNTSKPLVVIPATFLGGAVFCMLSDLIVRTLFTPPGLNISTVTAFFGAPVVIAMLLRRQKER